MLKNNHNFNSNNKISNQTNPETYKKRTNKYIKPFLNLLYAIKISQTIFNGNAKPLFIHPHI